MVRSRWIFVAGILLAAAGVALTADESPVGEGPAGNWKFTFAEQGRFQPTLWLLKFERRDGKWAGSVLANATDVEDATVEDVGVGGDRLQFTLKGAKLPDDGLRFEAKAPKEGAKTILGSISQGQGLAPARLEATKAKNFDELNKEILAGPGNSPAIFSAAATLLRKAADDKAKPEDVRAWADKAYKASEEYGPRWQVEVGTRIAKALVNQENFVAIALEYARKTERLLDPKDGAAAQVRVLDVLAAALKKAKKPDEAREVEARIDKLEAQTDPEYFKKMPPLKPAPFAGRKATSDRAVLVELFTGAQCPPCVAADLAFDALEKAYKPTEVVLLEYHLHIPGPDPLANESSVARSEYYSKEIEGTPTILFNGKAEAAGGGSAGDANDKLKEYRQVIDPLLEKPAKAKVKATAVRKGDRIDITAEASDVDRSDNKARLRLVLVEEQVRYAGGNRMRFHHRVVRGMPGGPEGVAIKDKTGKQSATVDLNALREDLNKYLDEFETKERPFPSSRRPLNLKKLYVIAFVQDDATKEVLQSQQVEVPSAESE